MSPSGPHCHLEHHFVCSASTVFTSSDLQLGVKVKQEGLALSRGLGVCLRGTCDTPGFEPCVFVWKPISSHLLTLRAKVTDLGLQELPDSLHRLEGFRWSAFMFEHVLKLVANTLLVLCVLCKQRVTC